MEIVVGTINTDEGQKYARLFRRADNQRKIDRKYLSFVEYEKFKLDKFWMLFSLFGMALTIGFALVTAVLWKSVLWSVALKTGFPAVFIVFCAIVVFILLVLEWKGFRREWLKHIVNWEIVHQNASGAQEYGIFLSSQALFFRSASRVVVHIPRSRIERFFYGYDSLSKEKTLFVGYLNSLNRPDIVPLVHLNYPDPEGLLGCLCRWRRGGMASEPVRKLLETS
jgi:hypothetical protein